MYNDVWDAARGDLTLFPREQKRADPFLLKSLYCLIPLEESLLPHSS